MPEIVTQEMLNRYRDDIDRNGVAGAVRTYAELMDKGYNYAGWAKGVAEARGINQGARIPEGAISGRAAVLFMKNTSGRDFSEAELNKIRIEMAQAYLVALEANMGSRGQTRTDANFEQIREFHRDVFEANRLKIGNWTLETPMKLIREYEGGKAAQEKAWQDLAKTQGDYADALAASFALYRHVQEYAKGYFYTDSQGRHIPPSMIEGGTALLSGQYMQVRIAPEHRQEAQEWLKNVDLVKPLLKSENEWQRGLHAGASFPLQGKEMAFQLPDNGLYGQQQYRDEVDMLFNKIYDAFVSDDQSQIQDAYATLRQSEFAQKFNQEMEEYWEQEAARGQQKQQEAEAQHIAFFEFMGMDGGGGDGGGGG